MLAYPAGLTSEEAAACWASHDQNELKLGKTPGSHIRLLTAILQPFNLLMVPVAVLTISPPSND